MNITIQHTELGRYALITAAPGQDIELLLDDVIPTSQCLRRHAEALRRKSTTGAGHLASLIETAADRYESGIH
ncbi:hypothetical protein [Acidithiobacillus ferrooxidans]|uniref:hypothetical protein n=1 Tax=Acidithiobacillus ferrooxidans TaxID=920 RepID=UPI000AAF6C14|nr:hypothetical protein [Acidithiobacillus ferrooxidans]